MAGEAYAIPLAQKRIVVALDPVDPTQPGRPIQHGHDAQEMCGQALFWVIPLWGKGQGDRCQGVDALLLRQPLLFCQDAFALFQRDGSGQPQVSASGVAAQQLKRLAGWQAGELFERIGHRPTICVLAELVRVHRDLIKVLVSHQHGPVAVDDRPARRVCLVGQRCRTHASQTQCLVKHQREHHAGGQQAKQQHKRPEAPKLTPLRRCRRAQMLFADRLRRCRGGDFSNPGGRHGIQRLRTSVNQWTAAADPCWAC